MHPFLTPAAMSPFIETAVVNRTAFLSLNRPQALNALSLDMIRGLTSALLAWRDDPAIDAVVLRSTQPKAFCAGGDIRFFHQVGTQPPVGGSALLEDFFTEEYTLNHLIHTYPKPYIALLDGVVMGGGMGISQAGPQCRMRIVTEKTKMAMPEVIIGLFPDVGGSYFLTRAPGKLGAYLALSCRTIGAADALYAGLADVFVPSEQLAELQRQIPLMVGPDLRAAIVQFAAPYRNQLPGGFLEQKRPLIDRVFSASSMEGIFSALELEPDPFASQTLDELKKGAPLMQCVTLEQLRRGAEMSLADCLRMERSMVRHCFEHGISLEGIRARVVDKDNSPRWDPPRLEWVTPKMVDSFFIPSWPDHAHPLRHLG